MSDNWGLFFILIFKI